MEKIGRMVEKNRNAKKCFMLKYGWGVLSLLVWMIFLSCGKEAGAPDASAVPESFTFFEIGANTRLTDRLRADLQSKLGNAAISGRNVLNLEIHYNNFLREHFPELEILNRRLNGTAGMRIEHDTMTLMYRHMSRLITPFEFVELIFDELTRKPLVIRIRSGREDADILETLKRPYGNPRTIVWAEGNSHAYYWEKNNDVLILSITPNPVGKPVYEISMVYVNSIEALLKREREGQKEERKEEESAVKDAFSQRAVHPPDEHPSFALADGWFTAS